MKSKAIKILKSKGIRKIKGKKIEQYNFYELCGFLKQLNK